MSVAGYVKLTIKYLKEGDVWVGICDELGVSNFGDTFEEAKEATEESVFQFLDGLERHGERERFFNKYNIKLYSTKPKSEILIHKKTRAGTMLVPIIQPIKEPVAA